MRRVLALCLIAACGDDAADGADAGPTIDAAPPADGSTSLQRGEIRLQESHADQWASAQVRLRFADRFPETYRVEAAAGACELRHFGVGFCDPACGFNDWCTLDDVCEPWYLTPIGVGTLHLTGLNGTVIIEPDAESYYRYYPTSMELFAAGVDIAVSASGDAWPAFSLSSQGVADIDSPDFVDEEIQLVDGRDQRVRWTPSGDPLARVRLTLNSTTFTHGVPPTWSLVCHADDAAGELVIPGELITLLPALQHQLYCLGIDCPPSELTRFREVTTPVPGGHVVLSVETSREFWPLHAGDER